MQAGSAGDIKSDINVTPLVDVVLVLLIIFMVVTPMLQKGQAVRLPSTASPLKVPEDAKQILVVVNDKMEYWIEQEREKSKMTEAQFPQRIRETYQRNRGSSIVIKADSRLPYGVVKKTMMAVKDAGFQEVGLIAEKKQKAF